MAKGFEDTVLYIYNRFISLNEVGGNPIKFGISLKNFHRFNRVRLLNWKHTLNSTSTHDTKRGEDVRARLNVLSELPDEWNDKIKLWSKLNNNFKKDNRYPDANDEYFLYQTLVGSYPFSEKEHSAYVKRIKEYVIKAVRGAKVYTAWIKPDEEYENVFTDFIDKILNHAQNNRFFKDFISFQKKIAYYGIFNSLSQTLIKITSPGVPDFYQGREMWDLFLVDPDNRRLVNFEKRKKALSKIIDSSNSNFKSSLSYYYKNITDGKIKLFLIYKALKVRKAFMELFNEGDYLPLDVSGDYNKNIIAFAREFNGNYCISIVPRFLTKLIKENEFPFGTKIWKDTFLTLPFNEGNLIDAFTEEHVNPDENKIPIGRILKNFPVSLLVSENNYKIGSRSNTKQKRKP